jgi:hypothetical protein
MTINKEIKSLGMPWEKEYGYAQAEKVGDSIYVSGQVRHDDRGNIVGPGDMETQMNQAYINIQKVLAQYGATMDSIVDEILFVQIWMRLSLQRIPMVLYLNRYLDLHVDYLLIFDFAISFRLLFFQMYQKIHDMSGLPEMPSQNYYLYDSVSRYSNIFFYWPV